MALAKAMREAGFETAAQRLLFVAKDAIRNNPKSWDGARDYVTSTVKTDAALMCELFAPYWKAAIDRLIANANHEIHTIAAQTTVAVQPHSIRSHDHHTTYGSRIEDRRPSNQQRHEAGVRSVQNQSTLIRLSILDTMRIGRSYRPIGDCTPEEVDSWASLKEGLLKKDAREIEVGRLLAANSLPGKPIRNSLSGEDADKIIQGVSRD